MERLGQERDNFRVALDWLIAHDNAAWGLRIAQGLFRSWERGEDISEGRRRLAQLLALPSAQAPTATRAKSLFCAAGLTNALEDVDGALALIQESLDIYRRLHDRRGQVASLNAMALYLTDLGRTDEARACCEACLELWRELGDNVGYGRTLSNYAFLLRREGKLERARQLYQEATAMFEREGDRVGAACEV